MSFVCLMMGLRVPPHLTMTLKALPRALDLRGGGGYYYYHYEGGSGPNLEDPTPYSYKGQARKPYLFIYFFQEGTPWVLHLHLRQFAFMPRAKFLCRVRMPIAV